MITSVTVCSTWMRGFISMKNHSLRVEIVEELDRAGVVVADLAARCARRRRTARARTRRPAARRPARSRPPSDAGAAPSSRARAGAARCRAGRRGSAPRCAWRAGCTSRGTRRRLPKARSASPCASSSSAPRSPALCTTRMPRPPPPNAALMMSGKPIVRAALQRLGSRSATGSSVPGSVGDAGGPGRGARRRLVAHALEQLRPRARRRRCRPARRPARTPHSPTGSRSRDGSRRRPSPARRRRCSDVEIRPDRPLALADQVGLVGLEAVHAEAVLLRVDGDGAQAEFGGRAEDADGDLAAVGGHELLHGTEGRGASGGRGVSGHEGWGT